MRLPLGRFEDEELERCRASVQCYAGSVELAVRGLHSTLTSIPFILYSIYRIC